MRLRTLLRRAAAIGISLAGSAHAFESYEHRDLGNLSFRVAVAYFRAVKKDPGLHAAVEQRLLENKQDDRVLDYGRIVACVDYFLYSERLLVEWRALRGKDYKLGPQTPTSIPFYREFRDWNDTAQCYRINGEFFQATHNNHAHFGNGALSSFGVLHLSAIGASAQKSTQDENTPEEKLYTALVINAIADHYLHDFLAPGHIYTQRERLSDVYARSRHDDYNYGGAPFVPNIEKLLSIASFICNGPPRESIAGREPAATEEDVPCKSLRESLGLDKLQAEPAQIEAALKDMKAGKAIQFRGDDLLWKSSSPEQLKQRVYMLLVSTQSVLDVFKKTNTFENLHWETGTSKNHPAAAKVAYGEYDLRPERAAKVSSITVVGLSYARESMSSGEHASRNLFSFEGAFGFGTSKTGIAVNAVPFIGYTHYTQGAFDGGGPTLRAAFTLPSTEFSHGPYLRALSYPTQDKETRRLSFGYRIDSGFSSFFTFFLGLGRDYATTPDRNLQRGLTLMAGVAVLLPTSLIPQKPPTQ